METKYKVAFDTDIVPEKTLERFVEINSEYKNALRKLRDEVMSDDIAEALKRCLIDHRNDDTARKILKNQINGKYGWENNQAITRSKFPTGELYRSDFQKDATRVKFNDIIGNGTKVPGSSTGEKIKNNHHRSKIGKWAHSPSAKWALGIAGGAAALSLIGYAGYKIGWLSPMFVDEEAPGHLSKLA